MGTDAVPPHARCLSLIACLGLVLGLWSARAAAAEPASVKGRLTYAGKVYTLQHVYAWQPPLQEDELWIYLTDNPVPAAAARHRSLPEQLAHEKRFGGVKIIVRPVQPRLDEFKGVVYAPAEDGLSVDRFSFGPGWQELTLADREVAGRIRSRWLNWTLEAEFSAHVFGSTGTVQTITGPEAQSSAQADVFVAFEKALVEQDLDAAGAYMTPEKLADMRARIERVGEASFREFQARRRASTPLGEARRRQVERVDIDGDYAELGASAGPDDLHVALLVRTGEGWKIAEW